MKYVIKAQHAGSFAWDTVFSTDNFDALSPEEQRCVLLLDAMDVNGRLVGADKRTLEGVGMHIDWKEGNTYYLDMYATEGKEKDEEAVLGNKVARD